MHSDLFYLIQGLIRKTPIDWLLAASMTLRDQHIVMDVDQVLQRMPATGNADLVFLMGQVMRQAKSVMSWEALGWAIETTAKAYQQWQVEQQIELLLTGPPPHGGMSVRRIDQALYDLVLSAKSEIMLVTFAAAKIKHLIKALVEAHQRGVRIALILEFEQSSEGQLTYDALRAFPLELIQAVTVFSWPVEKRNRNQSGRPGKLHAKVALIDDAVLISSANLTDDAFNRNLEVGIKLEGGNIPKLLHQYFDGLCGAEVLVPVKFIDNT
jgi:phosphatidylserine/phosphatidylglycerophosphate/cardiolipin synthase-like enzyme